MTQKTLADLIDTPEGVKTDAYEVLKDPPKADLTPPSDSLIQWAKKKRENVYGWPWPRLFHFAPGGIVETEQRYEGRSYKRFEFPVIRIDIDDNMVNLIPEKLHVSAKGLLMQIVDWAQKYSDKDLTAYTCLVIKEGHGRGTKYTFRAYEERSQAAAAYLAVTAEIERREALEASL